MAEHDSQPRKRSTDGQSQEYDAIEVLCLPESREQSDPNGSYVAVISRGRES